MAGFKRERGTYKKSFTKKRSAEEDDDAPRGKKAKADEEETGAVIPKLAIDDDGNQFIGSGAIRSIKTSSFVLKTKQLIREQLNASGKRRVTVSDYNKSTLISIREYWSNDAGELKPGKKGISLTIDQYNTLLAAAPLIESALAKKDIEVVRPEYDAKPNERTKDDDAADGSGEEEAEAGKLDDEEDDEDDDE